MQLTLSRHNGTHMKDYGASWWDDLTVEGIVTSSFRIDILSHVAGEDIKVIEIELYVGHGGLAFVLIICDTHVSVMFKRYLVCV